MTKHAKKKIVILTVPFGGGHLTVAKIIAEALREQGGDSVEVKTLNIFDDWLPGSPKFFARAYEGSVKNVGSLWYRLFFNFSDARPGAVHRFFTLIFRPLATRLLEREEPDLVISTFSIISYVAHQTFKKHNVSIPLISIVTDAGEVHKLWLMGVEDKVIVATRDTIDYAAEHGVPREKLYYLGFPVLKSFCEAPPKLEARASLGLAADRPTVLFTNGGLGMNPKKMLAIAETIAGQSFPYQVLFVCGQNQELRERIEAMRFTDAQVRVYGYVDNMPALMAASDVVCTKAGWLSLSEALETRRPVLVFDFIHGHEEPNARYVVRSGYGELITNPESLVDRLNALLTAPALLKPYEQALAERPSGKIASAGIAKLALATIKEAE